MIKTELFSWETCLYAKSCKQCIRFTNAKGPIHVAPSPGKYRLMPLEKVTIPRLELCAAVLSVNLDVKVKRVLEFHMLPSTSWTDIEITLAYTNSEPKRFKVFVGNRVATIRCNSFPEQWKHIKSSDNVAAVLSLGCAVKRDSSDLGEWSTVLVPSQVRLVYGD